MKAAPFEYARPANIAAACALLAGDEDARLIAGGQTLVPMMAMRLARPALLVDISRLPELDYIKNDGDRVALGAATKQARAEKSPLISGDLPLLARALPWVGHDATRSRGTIGGSIANADPAAEIALVLATLEGSLLAQSPRGLQTYGSDEFFLGPMTTALPPDNCLVEAAFPVWDFPRVGASFLEISARHGDFAYVSAAAQVALDADGNCAACAVGVGGGTPVPTRLNVDFIGSRIDEKSARDKLAAAIEALEIMTDPHASVAYRRRVSLTLALRALLAARDEALAMEARP